jgi:ribose 5-phosphate isomerase A
LDSTLPGKEAAARAAAILVEAGMLVGLGSGSTAALFVRTLGERVRAGLRIVGVPTSEATARLAHDQGIPLTSLDEHPRLDLDVDGADAVDPALNLLKGLGGALLREKIVAASSARFVVVVDERKLVDTLDATPVVPVEVIPFGWMRTGSALEELGAGVTRRVDRDNPDQPFVTDGGHFVLDCRFESLGDPATAAAAIKSLTGVVDHGLFIDLASQVIVGTSKGSVRAIER